MKITIIAEIGINHDGSFDKAVELTDMAIDSGADIVKYQYYKAETSATAESEKPPHVREMEESQFDLLKMYEISEEDLAALVKHCRKRGVLTCCSGDVKSDYDTINRCGVDVMKFGSDGVFKHDLIEHVASFGKPVILSSGMSYMGDVEDAIKAAKKKTDDVTILHCTSQYPTEMKNVNLNCITTMKNQLDIPVGYSDHTPGVEVSIAAVALGATMIERHFIDTHESDNPDEAVSLDPAEFKMLRHAVDNIVTAMGSSIKKPTEFEMEMMKTFRHSIVALTTIKEGETFTEANLGYKRPGTGLNPRYFTTLLGKKARKDFKTDHVFSWDDVL